MNGSTLTLSLVGALALGAAVGRRGSRSGRWVYHLTYRSDLPSIARQGLTPRSDTQEAWDNEPGVYFVNTFGYEAGAPESEEPAWLRLPAPHALPASFWTSSLQEGHTLISFPPDAIEVWVDAEGRPAAKADGVAWKPLREVVHVKRGSRATDPTSTPAFRRWFGESKVVDAEGRPRVVYHGTTAPRFDAFVPRGTPRKEHLAFGFHFAADEELAARYAFDPAVRRKATKGGEPRVIEAWLSIQNPFDATGWVEHDSEGYALLKEIVGRKLRPFMVQDGVYLYRVGAMLDHAPPERVEQILRAHGYDGVRYTLQLGFSTTHRRTITGEGVGWIAFDPTQIKSATGNRGTFDPADPRISFNRAPATDAALRTLRAAMVKAARADTAYAPATWTRAKDPLTGHCYGAAHLVQDRFGGEIVKGTVRGEAHAWNRLPGGREVDLTGSQYGGDGMHPLVQGEGVATSRSTNPRFARFAARVDAQLALR